ncbi:MAG: ribosome recycling factor [Candidatus Liptonbacteria bacterium]|nr:ribosome recycling factor [Candidatus Liptonbacteria bacterium]
MIDSDIYRELESSLTAATGKLKQDLSGIRSNRPSVELVENVKVSCYDQILTVKQLGSLSLAPPREIQVVPWDKSTIAAIAKAIDDARVGLSVTHDGNLVRATLSPLGEERREELAKIVKKTGEATRIQIRSLRDETIKRGKAAQDRGELSEDVLFKLKERIQKLIDRGNGEIESAVNNKLAELGE